MSVALASVSKMPSTPSLASVDSEVNPELTETLSKLTRTVTRQTLHRHETRPAQGPGDVLDLPYDILNDDANMEEYTEETAEGIIPKRTVSRVSGRIEDHELVTFQINDPQNPKNWSKAYKWYACYFLG